MKTRIALALCLGLLAIAPLQAEEREFALRYGQDGSSYDAAGANLRFAPWWSTDRGNWTATLRPELELGHFRYTGPASGPSAMNEAAGSGLFRLHYGEGAFRPYAEVGLGLALFSNDRLGAKNLSTRFQFTEHVGLGIEFSRKWFAGWRYSHYSNADIKKPNDGLDVQQIVIGIRF